MKDIPDIAAYNSLFAFCFKYRHLTPPNEWHPEPVHHKVCNLVQDAIENKKRIVITMPPQHGKSQITSIYAPAWYLWRNPSHNFALVTYSAELAEDKSMKCRNVVRNSFDTKLSPEAQSRKNWALSSAKDMSFRARGIGGGLTGNTVHCLALDDLLKNHEEAESETIRRKIRDFIESTILTRLNDDAPAIAILTRWHMDDYANYLINKLGWDLYNFPAICDDPDDDLLGREKGEVLAPKRHSLESIMKVKRNVSPYVFNALYQGNPIASEAVRIRREWFKYYDPKEIDDIARVYNVYQTVDTAATDKEKSDYFVVLTFALITKTLDGRILTDANEYRRYQQSGQEMQKHIYVLDVYRNKVETTDHEDVLRIQREKWRPVVQYVENVTFGLVLIQSAQKKGLPIDKLDADKSKTLRSEQVSIYYRNGQVWHPKEADWLEDFENEISTFPNAKHDDQFDCISYAGIVAAKKAV